MVVMLVAPLVGVAFMVMAVCMAIMRMAVPVMMLMVMMMSMVVLVVMMVVQVLILLNPMNMNVHMSAHYPAGFLCLSVNVNPRDSHRIQF